MRSALLAAAFFGFAAQAQFPPASETINVSVVEIDVSVLDAHGQPVRGLQKDDFELKVDGRRTPITNFYEVNRRPEGAAAQAAAPQAAHRDYVVLFVDDLHLDQHEKKRTIDALRAYVQQHVNAGTAAMLVLYNGDVHILHRFTEDPGSLMQSIDSIEQQPARVSEIDSERREVLRAIEDARKEVEEQRQAAESGRAHPTTDYAAIARQQMDTYARHQREITEGTIAAIAEVVQTIRGLDGRRALVYVSDGLPLQPAVEVFQSFRTDELMVDDSNQRFQTSSGGTASSVSVSRVLQQMQPGDAMSTNLTDSFSRLARQSALAGVQIFAIDANGVNLFDGGASRSAPSRLDASLIRSNTIGPLKLLADETGGEAFVDTNDLSSAFAQLDERLSSFYSLGFRADGGDRDSDISVGVKRRGLTVRASRHLRQQSERERIADRVRAAFYAPFEENPLGAAVTLTPAADAGALIATVRVPTQKLSVMPEGSGYSTAFWVFVALMDDQQRETPVRMFMHRINAAESDQSVHSLRLNVTPGKYLVSVAIADPYSSQVTYLQKTVTVTR